MSFGLLLWMLQSSRLSRSLKILFLEFLLLFLLLFYRSSSLVRKSNKFSDSLEFGFYKSTKAITLIDESQQGQILHCKSRKGIERSRTELDETILKMMKMVFGFLEKIKVDGSFIVLSNKEFLFEKMFEPGRFDFEIRNVIGFLVKGSKFEKVKSFSSNFGAVFVNAKMCQSFQRFKLSTLRKFVEFFPFLWNNKCLDEFRLKQIRLLLHDETKFLFSSQIGVNPSKIQNFDMVRNSVRKLTDSQSGNRKW